MASGSSNSPCAACKFLRRKCTSECVFAPYFPPEEPQKFANVHKIFGASNVTKLLNDLAPQQREAAVTSLAYEAEARLRDPVYGCVGAISVLQRQVQLLQKELAAAHADLLQYTSAFDTGPPDLFIPAQTCLSPSIPHYSKAQMMGRQQVLVQPPPQQQPQLTREQVLELAMRMGGSLEAGLSALGVTNTHAVQSLRQMYPSASPPSRPGSGGGSGSSGGSLGHLSTPEEYSH
ncbi:protein LATERAL ORGAN BOUNDARIES [Cryptomeria japonica]|uniref:protein LATERAL ORGAN BOUNDARIES n=1 Tax=Cryptomeria japonica TaxID=3369 RepID=UPI0027DA3D54|nr:protein LATERAL ORGAN BOUNDARIES [Cryptomeria japonica]